MGGGGRRIVGKEESKEFLFCMFIPSGAWMFDLDCI